MMLSFTRPSRVFILLRILMPLLLIISMFLTTVVHAQQTPGYPRVSGYFAISNAIGSWNKNGFTSNFSNSYSVAFPMGINLLKSDRFGVSFEIAPCIQTVNNLSRVSSVTINPGAIFRFDHGFTLYGRLSFETAGRFGFGPTFSKVLIKGKNASCFASVPVPVRFGNNAPASVGTGIIVGVSF